MLPVRAYRNVEDQCCPVSCVSHSVVCVGLFCTITPPKFWATRSDVNCGVSAVDDAEATVRHRAPRDVERWRITPVAWLTLRVEKREAA